MRCALVVGRSADALEEVEAALRARAFDALVVVGKMGEVFPHRIDHWVSFHAELFDKWAAARTAAGYPAAQVYWTATYRGRSRASTRAGAALTACRPLRHAPCVGGSSGFLAVQVARDVLKFDRIVLAGVPMTPEGGHLASTASRSELNKPWADARMYWATWEDHADRLRPHVRSMSGRTRVLFGAPADDWLDGGGRW